MTANDGAVGAFVRRLSRRIKRAAMASDAATVLGQVTWSEETKPLRELLKRQPAPLLVKVAKGQYLSAAPGGALLLTSAGRRRRLLAQSVKFKDSRRLAPLGPKLLVPDSFEGLFEILSEEGRSVRAIESVAELVRRFPDSCIARDSCKAYVSKSDNVETITDRSRTIQSGETLVLVGEVVRPRGRGQSRFLRCFDASGENVYLPHEQRVRFSAVAKEENISGVHSVANLLNKRLPLNVRMISGRAPELTRLGSGVPPFAPELRLHTTFDEDMVVASALSRDGAPLPLPPTAPLRVHTATNTEQLLGLAEFGRLRERAEAAWAEVADRIQPFDLTLPPEPRPDSKGRAPRPRGYRRSMTSPMSRITSRHSGEPTDEYDEIDQIYDYVRGFAPLPRGLRQTVMGGGASERRSDPEPAAAADSPPEPPPIETIPSRRSGHPSPHSPPGAQRSSHPPSRPVSGEVRHPGVFVASLERVGARSAPRDRRVAEKRTREPSKPQKKSMAKDESKQSIKLFAKSGNAKPKPRFFRHKSASPLKNSGVYYPLTGSAQSTGPSPIFNIRYKSLNNLAMDVDTLNSSNSGGKTSGDSGDSAVIKAKLPEKKSKKLGRPKSMSNLLWDATNKLAPAVEMYVKPSVAGDQERTVKLEPGVYKRRNSTVMLNNKFNSQKKVGTLYLSTHHSRVGRRAPGSL
ncbi:hypothetical protein FJT64_001616 [Amphibalanus amphitrite]|uniref:CABIT domain-containing protein n=1 Tax=Amphibalanus amphitrite TaxID=1232801 RepID=A0A6A4XFZ5_AMPAM|nr:hypothetical protein FJT64_001616 [Amphibalanus amphitrite]